MEIKREFDKSVEMKPNAMLVHRPELFDEWDFEKNDKLGLDIYKVTFGSTKKAWWICRECKSDYLSSLFLRIGENKNSCCYCSGRKVNHTNSLATLNPSLASQWHPTMNGDLTPHDVTHKKILKVWWMGECGHEWASTINSRDSQGVGCPYCSGRIVLKGFNDMWTTNPKLASQLLYLEDGYKYSEGSRAKVNWVCLTCKGCIENKLIATVNYYGLSCIRCSDGVSFGEKFIGNILSESGIKYIYDKSKKWSQGKRYDFHLTDYNWIIEVHGEQHYSQRSLSTNSFGQIKTLKEEQENDKLKKQMALENGTINYITIDARISTVEWLKNSVLESQITKIIKDIDFNKIGELASKNLIKETCKVWGLGMYSLREIGEILKIDRNTVARYLRRGNEIGWCNYCPDKSRKDMSLLSSRARTKKIVQLSKEYSLLNHWNSASEAGRSLGIGDRGISRVCRGVIKTSGGFIWMYKQDYERYLSGSLELSYLDSKRGKEVVQLSSDSQYVQTFPSQTKASKSVGLLSSVSIFNSCSGATLTAGGYKWMYEKDYYKMLEEELSREEYMNKYYPKTK